MVLQGCAIILESAGGQNDGPVGPNGDPFYLL